MRLHPLTAQVAVVLALLSPAALPGQNHGATLRDRSPQYVPNQLLVRFKPGSANHAMRANARFGAKVKADYTAIPGLQLVQLQPGTDFNQALNTYRADPTVLYAEPNYIRKPLESDPNDLYFSDLWNLHNTGQKISFPGTPDGPAFGTPGDDIHALEAWGITTGSSSVVIGLIDTGVDYNHEDLAANMYKNQADCNSNGVDDDGNGYIDDCYGIDALDNTSDPMDQVGHGTHVAGIMGAVGNNSLGITGINWNVRILTCKFLGFGGGTDDGAIACLNYMAVMKDRGVNIVATNNSWGGYGYSQALYDAIDAQRQRGILFVAAAGNESNDNDGPYALYPASYSLDNIISVAATTYTDDLATFSNFGKHTVDIGAPGYRILSTTPDNTYSIYDGTSMATPHVTGVAALLAAQDSTRNWKTIRNLILSSGDPAAALASTVTQARLNAYTALTCSNRPFSAPMLPSSSSLLATSGQAMTVSEMNINCGDPAGNPQIAITPGAGTLTLLDDGNAPDKDAGDGTYTGQWTPSSPGLYTLTYPAGQTVTVAVDPYTYTSSAFNYRSIAGTNLNLADETFGFIESPFPLSFGGGAYEAIYASDNGYLTFDSALPSTGKAVPYQYANTIIAPFWDDLVPTTNGNVYWAVNGTAPNRELVVEWRNMGHAGCKTDGSESITFQTVFFENSTDILFNYLKTAFGGTCTANDNGNAASVGIQATPTVGKQYSFQTAGLADNTAVTWNAVLPQNLVPSIKALSPKSFAADVFDYYLDVTGSNFGNNSVMMVNGSPRQTYVFSSSELLGVVRAADLASPGTLQISVFAGLPGGGPSATVPLSVNADDFSVQTASSFLSIKSGSAGTVTVNVWGNPVFYDGVSLACTGLPANASCTFDPSRILAGGYSILTIATAPPTTGRLRHAPTWLGLFLPFAGMVLCSKSQSRKRMAVAVLLVLMTVVAMISCGGGSAIQNATAPVTTPVTPTTASTNVAPGTYTVTITATSKSVQHSTTISLVVTQ